MSRKSKSAEYKRKTKEWNQKFEELKLDRPQDTNLDLLHRARQVNFGLLSCQENPMRNAILNYQPLPEIEQPKGNFKCYPGGNKEPHWVDTQDKFQRMMDRLMTCDEITIDLEMHNHKTMTDFVSLIQIGTWNYEDYLIDPFKVRKEIIHDLKPILESTKLLKVGHDLTNDVKWLQKDFDIFLVAAVDTQIMYSFLYGETQVGFSKLAANYHPELASQLCKETVSVWRLRPGQGMSKEQESYARDDVHILLRIFDELRNEMIQKDISGGLFRAAVDRTKNKLLSISSALAPTHTQPDYQGLAATELQQCKDVTSDQMTVLASLLEWRDMLAKILDYKPNQLVSIQKLLRLSELQHFETDDKDEIQNQVQTIKRILGKVDQRIATLDTKKPKQA